MVVFVSLYHVVYSTVRVLDSIRGVVWGIYNSGSQQHLAQVHADLGLYDYEDDLICMRVRWG